MTTPAVSYFRITDGPWTLSAWDGTTSSGSNPKSTDSETRPASSTCGRIGNLKLCDSFHHYGNHLTKEDSVESATYDGNDSHYFDYRGNIWDGYAHPPSADCSSNLIIKAQQKALLKLKNQDLHLGNFVAEAHKTIEMVAGHAETVAKQVLNFRRHSPKAWKQVKRVQTGGLPRHRWHEIPNDWLELQYGWLPLMSDINGGLQHLQKRKRFSLPLVHVSGRSEDSDIFNTTHSSRIGTTIQADWKCKFRVHCFLTYGLSSPVLAELSSLGLINPLEIVWEVTRYSFVVDWFLPVGDWLSSLTADVGYDFISGGHTETVETKFSGYPVLSVNHFVKMLIDPYFNVTGQHKAFDRHCYPTSPSPGLYVKNPLSHVHVANALSLLVQAFK